jgi:hypothetical protein
MNAMQKLYIAILSIFTNFYDLYINPISKIVTLKNAKVNEDGTVEDVTLENMAKVKENFEKWKNTLIQVKTITIPSVSVASNAPTLLCDIASLGVKEGTYTIVMTWDAFADDRDNYYIWDGGLSGIFYLVESSNYNNCPAETLVLNGTVHHRNIELPSFTVNSIDDVKTYSNFGLFINLPINCIIKNLKITFTKIGD